MAISDVLKGRVLIAYGLVALGIVFAIAMMPTKSWMYSSISDNTPGVDHYTFETALLSTTVTVYDTNGHVTQSTADLSSLGSTTGFELTIASLNTAGAVTLACGIVSVVSGIASVLAFLWHVFKPSSRKFWIGFACACLSCLMIAVGSILYARLSYFSWSFILYVCAGYTMLTGAFLLTPAIVSEDKLGAMRGAASATNLFSY